MNEAIVIIPARGGSKRLPGKNILEIEGAPVLNYPVSSARQAGIFSRIIVSTEDATIADVARCAGAEVMHRPECLATDRATVTQVCSHVLETLAGRGQIADFFCCIYATALFITADDLKASLARLKGEEEPDVVMGVSRFNLQPVQALELQPSGFLSHKWPEFDGVQSQFQPRLVVSNGTFYWARTKPFMENCTFYPERLAGYEIPWIRAIDLDTPEDLENVRLLAPRIFRQSQNQIPGQRRSPFNTF